MTDVDYASARRAIREASQIVARLEAAGVFEAQRNALVGLSSIAQTQSQVAANLVTRTGAVATLQKCVGAESALSNLANKIAPAYYERFQRGLVSSTLMAMRQFQANSLRPLLAAAKLLVAPGSFLSILTNAVRNLPVPNFRLTPPPAMSYGTLALLAPTYAVLPQMHPTGRSWAERRLARLQAELTALRAENEALVEENRRLKQQIIGTELGASQPLPPLDPEWFGKS